MDGEDIKRHLPSLPVLQRPPGALEVCRHCGAVRVYSLPGYRSSGWWRDGKRQPWCHAAVAKAVGEER